MSNVLPGHPAGASEDQTKRAVSALINAAQGNAGQGVPIDYSQYDGTSFALRAISKDTTFGKALETASQNALYGIVVRNSGLFITGAPTLSALTVGSVLFVGAGKVLGQDNANFFWDDTNNRLGIGTATPSQTLDIGAGKVTVAGATGNTVILGTGSIVGNVSIGAIGTPTMAVTASTGDIATVGNVAAVGQVVITQGTITASKSAFQATATWNSGATIFTEFSIAITDTASNAASLIADWRVGGVTQFKVSKAGIVTGLGLPVFNGGANLWYAPLMGVCSAGLTLTSSFQDITGATVTLAAVGKWLVTASVEFVPIGAGDAAQLLSAQLSLAAGSTADNTGLVICQMDAGDTAFGVTAFQQWIVTMASGTGVIKLQGKKAAGTGSSVIVAANTKLSAIWCGNV